MKVFKTYVDHEFTTRWRGQKPREEIISERLQHEALRRPPGATQVNVPRQEFFVELKLAWDTLAYEQYEPGSEQEKNTAFSNYHRYRNLNKAVWVLSPEQTRIIDALAEATDIPRQRGHPIVMPDYLKNQPQWHSSAEYLARVAAARAKRGK